MIWLKRLGVVIGALLAFITLAIITILAVTSSRFNTEYEITTEPFVVPSDSMAISHGKHIAVTRGCAECHGEGLGGHIFLENPAMGRIVGTNLTSGTGGIDDAYTDADWMRAIRHGVGTDGKPLLLMPAEEYYYLNDRDLGALIAYLKSLAPIDNTPPETNVGLIARALFQFGKMPALVPAEVIHHDAARPDTPEPGPTTEYGAYLTRGCIGCHTSNLTGGPPVAPGWPPAPDITLSGDLSGWNFEVFQILMRTGEHPDGRILNPKYMPWTAYRQLSDTEHLAIWNYLSSL